MATQTWKSVFTMTPDEMREHLRPIAEKVRQDALDAGLWFSYQNDLCIEEDMFIHEFKDGRRELIQLGNQTGEYKILKVF